MRQQNVIIFSSGKNKHIAHEIARGLDGDVCKAVVWDEFFNRIYGEEYTLDLFRNTLMQFLLPDAARGRHVTATDAQTGSSTIFVDEFSFDEAADRQNLPWLVS